MEKDKDSVGEEEDIRFNLCSCCAHVFKSDSGSVHGTFHAVKAAAKTN